jgi:uncharacterized protein (DUF1778 family)
MSTLARLDLRIGSKDKARIESAARLRGVPISTFIRDVALREAAQNVAADWAVTLSAEESRRLLQALDEPWAPNAKLARALSAATAS